MKSQYNTFRHELTNLPNIQQLQNYSINNIFNNKKVFFDRYIHKNKLSFNMKRNLNLNKSHQYKDTLSNKFKKGLNLSNSIQLKESIPSIYPLLLEKIEKLSKSLNNKTQPEKQVGEKLVQVTLPNATKNNSPIHCQERNKETRIYNKIAFEKKNKSYNFDYNTFFLKIAPFMKRNKPIININNFINFDKMSIRDKQKNKSEMDKTIFMNDLIKKKVIIKRNIKLKCFNYQ